MSLGEGGNIPWWAWKEIFQARRKGPGLPYSFTTAGLCWAKMYRNTHYHESLNSACPILVSPFPFLTSNSDKQWVSVSGLGSEAQWSPCLGSSKSQFSHLSLGATRVTRRNTAQGVARRLNLHLVLSALSLWNWVRKEARTKLFFKLQEHVGSCLVIRKSEWRVGKHWKSFPVIIPSHCSASLI